ncbi:hypothetical protein BCR39DRAFT_278289 [Naematelia encephala]|uniref:Uncharacterized protein n=1 Tax=Naematelia encephala TaxID=71784 RepID=A0A1Y2ATE8_9TREE|nr:hypothetical protein BCR39DRAFT_278289 [Naematelia encephala]
MDRQLTSPLLITPLGPPTKLSASQTFHQLNTFLQTLPSSPARTQLERLADSLGVETGAIAPSEGDRREADRRAKKAAARLERRQAREALEREMEVDGLEHQVEGLEGDGDGDEDMEEGAVAVEGEQGMDDRGDVEYGDLPEDEDDDEPDNDDERIHEEKE